MPACFDEADALRQRLADPAEDEAIGRTNLTQAPDRARS